MAGRRTTGGDAPQGGAGGTAGNRSNLSPEKTTRPPSVLEAANTGDYRALVVALRDHIARQIDDGCAARDLVGLSRRLIDLAADLRAHDAREGGPDAPLRLVDAPFDPAAI